jgi:protein phosphatase
MSTSGPPSPPPIRLVVAGLTDVGRQRKHNEDCVLLRPEHGLYCVADGMGGHNAGDVASKLVTTSLGNYFEATGNGAPIGDLPDEYAALSLDAKRLAAGVRKANHDVFTISNTHAQHHGMGSTCVAIHIAGTMVHIAHVGDSRCYRVRDGQIQQMTRDHSLINDALDMKPDLTKEELSRLPKNIITRALGMKDVVKVDVKSEPILPGDVFLLCSDGLTGMVPPDQILEVITLTAEPQEACELLIAEANDAGGTDNISALIVRVEDATADHDVVADHEIEIEGEGEGEGESDHEIVEDHDIVAEPEHDEPVTRELVIEAHEEAAPAIEAFEEEEPDALSGPTLEVVTAEIDELPLLDEAGVAEAIAALQRGDAIDVDLHGPWPGRLRVRRCESCGHELYPGNQFCTECGTRIESATA